MKVFGRKALIGKTLCTVLLVSLVFSLVGCEEDNPQDPYAIRFYGRISLPWIKRLVNLLDCYEAQPSRRWEIYEDERSLFLTDSFEGRTYLLLYTLKKEYFLKRAGLHSETFGPRLRALLYSKEEIIHNGQWVAQYNDFIKGALTVTSLSSLGSAVKTTIAFLDANFNESKESNGAWWGADFRILYKRFLFFEE